MIIDRLSFCCSGIFFLSSFYSIDHLNDKKFIPCVAFSLSKSSVSPPIYSSARAKVHPLVPRSFAMCRKVSLLHIPPSAALWSLSINLRVKIAQKHRKKIICCSSTHTKQYPDTQDGCRSYPESNRGRPDSPSTSCDRRGIRTGSDNRYTIKPDNLMV
jgi:hypothetical protein